MDLDQLTDIIQDQNARRQYSDGLELLKLIRPALDAICEKPLPQLDIDGRDHKYQHIEGGFQKTFKLAPEIFKKVSPELYELYAAQLRGKHGLHMNTDNAFYINASRTKISADTASNPASLEGIGHELGHMMTPTLGKDSPLEEVPSILIEILISEILKEYAIPGSGFTATRLKQVNNCAKGMKAVNSFIDAVSEMNIDLSGAQHTTLVSITEQYRTHPSANKETLATMDKFLLETNEQTHAADLQSWTFCRQTDTRGHKYEIGVILGSILAKKIKNNEFTLKQCFDILDNTQLSSVERLAQLGITEITDDIIKDFYKFADTKCKQMQQAYVTRETDK